MALWKDSNSKPEAAAAQGASASAKDTAVPRERERINVTPLNPQPTPRVKDRAEMKESVIASDVSIEGKIVGSGQVRIAGRFKGDAHIDGNLMLDSGARLDGQVRADVVVVGGELHGNIENARRVELLDSGVINGDVKAGSLTVAAGSRMRGQVEFGWGEDDKKAPVDAKGLGTDQ